MSPLFRKQDFWQTGLVLTLVSLWYGVAVVPDLADFPPLDWAEMGIVAPAHKLATEGIYGNDLFAGFHRSEERNYEYMPLYPLLVSAAFEALGTGVWQARAVSVVCGWLVLILTFFLGRALFGPFVGLMAATFLVTLRPGLVPHSTGIALIDFAREIRYDILVPVLVLPACLALVWGLRRLDSDRSAGLMTWASFFASGVLAGLATLAHVYGAFLVVLSIAVIGLQLGWRSRAHFLIAAGWLVAVLPWLLYVLQDTAAYVGQMSRHQGRFAIFDLEFYWRNFIREPWRYAGWSGGNLETAFLSPRLGFWFLLLGIPASSLLLAWRTFGPGRSVEQHERLADRFLLVAFPSLQLCLALFILLKRYYYTTLVWPFLALQLAYLANHLLGLLAPARRKIVGSIVLLLLLIESGTGVRRVLAEAARATAYQHLGRAIGQSMPLDSRLLISQPYWLALTSAGYQQLRSLNLIFHFPEGESIDQIIASLDIDGVVVESYFLEPNPTDPRSGADNPRSRAMFDALASYLDEHCSGRVFRFTTPDYGTIETYDCRGLSSDDPEIADPGA